MASGRRPFSLAAAVFRIQANPDDPQVPYTWLVRFLKTQRDGRLRQGLFKSCREGRDTVLTTAPKATLTLDLRKQIPAARTKQLTAARQALLTRGKRPTSLVLKLSAVSQTDNPVASVATHLFCGPGINITELTLQVTTTGNTRALSVLLQRAVSCCPNLTTLTFTHCACPLPPPSALPQLKHLTLDCSAAEATADVCKSVAPYLRQLITLQLLPSVQDIGHVFHPTVTSHTLTHFSTGNDLTSRLLSLVRKHAPSLKYLSVQDIDRDIRDREGMPGFQEVCTFETLHIRGCQGVGTLGWVPKRKDGQRLRVEGPRTEMKVCVESEEGLDPSLFNNLQNVDLCIRRVLIYPDEDIPYHMLIDTLDEVLRELGDVEAPGTIIELFGIWDWSHPYTLSTLRSHLELGCLSQLSLLPSLELTLTDTLMSELTQMAEHGLRHVSVDGLALDTDHSHTHMCWDMLKVLKVCEVGQLMRLPDPGRRWEEGVGGGGGVGTGGNGTMGTQKGVGVDVRACSGLSGSGAAGKQANTGANAGVGPGSGAGGTQARAGASAGAASGVPGTQQGMGTGVGVSEARKRFTLACEELQLDNTSLHQAGLDRVRSWLSHTQLALHRYGDSDGLTITLICPGTQPPTHKWAKASTNTTTRNTTPALSDTQLCAALREQLSVLRCVTLADTDTAHDTKVRLRGWPLTRGVIDALQGLPNWAGGLDFHTSCTWPEQPAVYARLAQCVPVSFRKWRFDVPSAPFGAPSAEPAWLAPVFEGVRVRRAGKGLGSLSLVCDALYFKLHKYGKGLPKVNESVQLIPSWDM